MKAKFCERESYERSRKQFKRPKTKNSHFFNSVCSFGFLLLFLNFWARNKVAWYCFAHSSTDITFDTNLCYDCSCYFSNLGKSIHLYADEHNDTYPAYDKWCDLLLEERTVTEKDFRCPAPKKNKCRYAVNPNCEPNSPPDTVLLFETKGGWNQYGGPELLFPRHYENNKSCNVFFNGGKVKSIRPNELDKLNWGNKQKQ